MNWKKNDLVELEIVDQTDQGEGVGRLSDGFTLFVKHAIVGDVVCAAIEKVKKNYGWGRMVSLKTPSPWRVEAGCPKARACGGCQLAQMSYKRQLEFKRNKVENHLRRIGGLDVSVEPCIGMEEPCRYRNKMQVPVGYDKNDALVAGFYAGRSHNIISLPERDCLLADSGNAKILDIVLEHMKEQDIPAYDETTQTGLIRHILIRRGYTTSQWMVCIVANGNRLPAAEQLVVRLVAEVPGMTSISLNVNREATNVILGKEIISLYGPTYIEDYIGPVRFQISPLSFFQVNPVQTRRLYETALDFAGLTGEEEVWDLYCGIGTISLFLAQKAKRVRGIEIIPEAIADAKRNAALNGMDNAFFYVGSAEEVLPDIYEKEKQGADVIVVDPPRKGCDAKLLSTMVQMQPKRIVYVSCDSATLARDLKWLCEQGYGVERVQPVDMFPMTVHVESVVLLSREKVDEYVHITVHTKDLKR